MDFQKWSILVWASDCPIIFSASYIFVHSRKEGISEKLQNGHIWKASFCSISLNIQGQAYWWQYEKMARNDELWQKTSLQCKVFILLVFFSLSAN